MATISKKDADYRAQDGTHARRCETCSMYRQPGRCTLVEGKIRPQDICDYYEAKKK